MFVVRFELCSKRWVRDSPEATGEIFAAFKQQRRPPQSLFGAATVFVAVQQRFETRFQFDLSPVRAFDILG